MVPETVSESRIAEVVRQGEFKVVAAANKTYIRFLGGRQIMIHGTDAAAIERTKDVLLRLLERTLVRLHARAGRPRLGGGRVLMLMLVGFRAHGVSGCSTPRVRSSWPPTTATSTWSTRAAWYARAHVASTGAAAALTFTGAGPPTTTGPRAVCVCARPGGRPRGPPAAPVHAGAAERACARRPCRPGGRGGRAGAADALVAQPDDGAAPGQRPGVRPSHHQVCPNPRRSAAGRAVP